MKNNKAITLTLLLVVVISSLVGISFADDKDIAWKDLAGTVKNLMKTKDTTILVKVNGNAIREKDVQMYAALQNFSLKTVDESTIDKNMIKKNKDEILDYLIEEELLYQKAIELGYEVSEKEILKFMEQQEQLYNSIKNGETNIANKDEYLKKKRLEEEYIETLGISKEQYKQMQIKQYQRLFAKQQLFRQLVSEMPKTDQGDQKKVKQMLDDYRKQLKEDKKSIITKK